MKQQLATILFVFLAIGTSLATGDDGRGDPKYPVSAIPAELRENAHAVIRLKETTFTIVQRDKTVSRNHVVYTILDKEADNLGLLYTVYNGDSKIKEFEAVVYDEHGEEIDKLRKSDIKDQSYISGFSLFEDTRVQYADMTRPEYPYTVEFITESEASLYYDIPDYYPLSSSKISVEESRYTVKFPEELRPRYREVNFDGSMNEFKEDEYTAWRWEFKNLAAVETEPVSRGIRDLIPYVELAPTKFEHSGNPGDMSSWKSFGAWFWELNRGRDVLPGSVASEIQGLTNGMSDREKVKAIYEYMQDRTRYVSIQLGIGGLQPFEASTVNNVGYGDCKALTNYTYALLKQAGIQSYYTLVEAGEDPTPVSKDFPNDPFNHVILCVPMEKDTVWLECTSQVKPFNFLGTFTSNRDVLLITEEGGKLVRTPTYRLNDNQRIRQAKVRIDESGNARVEITAKYQGIQYDISGLSSWVHEGVDEQKEWIHSSTPIANYDLRSFEMANYKEEIPYAVVEMKMDLPKYASRTGKRFYFTPYLMNSGTQSLKSVDERKQDVIVTYDLAYTDTIEYEFPSDYQMEFLPEPVSIESEFGRYEARTEFSQGRLKYVRRMEIFSGEYPPDKYDDLREFLKDIESKDKVKVVLTTKT